MKLKNAKFDGPDHFVAAVSESANIAPHVRASDLQTIGMEACDDYKLDKETMSDWLERMDRGIKLATLVKETKTYPFDKASNVKYPLITSAALQFNARAYPAVVNTEEMVKARVYGEDPQGTKAKRGERVSAHMSYQLSSEIEEWEEETDKLLVQLPIVGTLVRKVWFDPAQERSRGRVIDAGKFIVNDRTKNLNDAPRASEELDLYPHEITERIAAEIFLDVDLEIAEGDEDSQKPERFIEQHTRLDLDDDDYEEPYIVTVHERTQKVVRIVADFEPRDVTYITRQEEQIVTVPHPESGLPMEVPQIVEVPEAVKAIRRGSYFVPYHFLPSLDGGFFGTGLGLLLGDISDSINSIMNMLLDAGHMSSLGGGFIGSELRLKGGAHRFRPGEWKQVSATGGQISSSVVPMTFPGPDATLFSMLGMLIDAGREIASVKDVMTGDSGQKGVQTATTTIALIEQGMAVFTAAYKRIFRSLKHEFKLIAEINAETVSPDQYNMFHDGPPVDPAADYNLADMDIAPIADPQTVTKMQEAAKAQLLMQLAEAGMVDPAETGRRVLQSMDISDRDALMPQPDPMAQQMQEAQFQLEGARVNADTQRAAADQMKAEAEMIKAQTPVDQSADIARLQSDERVKLAEIQTKAELEREKMANDLLIEREKMIADLQARQIEAASREEGDGRQADAVSGEFQALIETIQAQIAMSNAPKEVVRDDQGRVVGVRPVLN